MANFGSRLNLSAAFLVARVPLERGGPSEAWLYSRSHDVALVPVLTEWLMYNGPSGYLRTGAA